LRFLYIGLAVGMCSIAYGQVRPATEAEVGLIREALMLDQIPEWNHHDVLGVEGTFTDRSADFPARLDGWVTFEPYEIEDGLCMMAASFVTGLRIDEEYDWSIERFAYWNWDADRDRCDVASRSQIPDHAVQSNEPIPSATMAYVLANSNELLTLAYEYIELEIDETEPGRDRILAYRENGSFRIDRIAIAESSSPEFDLAYRATYRAPGRLEGPAVTFSVSRSGLVIHGVGLWTA
jgi:hypothetical protein